LACAAPADRAACARCERASEATGEFVFFEPPGRPDSLRNRYRIGRYAANEKPSPLAEILLRFKYAGDRAAGHGLRRLVAAAAANFGGTYDLVIPIPLHSKRLRERGYNLSAWLARGAASGLGASFDARALVRVVHTAPQALATRGQRALLVGAFEARAQRVQSRTILLVDDVCTSGATAADAARALLDSGAGQVDLAVLLLAGSDVASP
jgi:ComF family protein